MPTRFPRSRGFAAGLAAFLVAGCDIPTAPPRFETVFVVPGEEVTIPVLSQSATAHATYDLSDTEDLAGRARAGAIVVDVANPSGAIGQVQVRVAGGGAVVEGTIDLSAGNGQRISATQGEVQALLGHELEITVSGTLCPTSACAPVTAPPVRTVTFDTKLELTLELGGES